MEERSPESSFNGTRNADLRECFKLAVRLLLTTCSTEEFGRALPEFTSSEQTLLHRLYMKEMTTLQKNLEDQFESLCDETQLSTAFNTVEQLIEEQALDPLSSDKTNVKDTVNDLSDTARNEIHYLQELLIKVEKQNEEKRNRIAELKKGRQDLSSTTDIVKKVRSRTSSYLN